MNINNYVENLEDAYKNAKDIIETTIKHLTIEYSKKMNFHVSCVQLFQMKQEYNSEMSKLEKRLRRLDELYKKANDILKNPVNFDKKELDSILKEIKIEYRGKLPMDTKYGVFKKWREENSLYSKKDFKDMKSYINNFSTVIVKRMSEAQNVLERLMKLNRHQYMVDTINTIDSSSDDFEMGYSIDECDRLCKVIDDQRRKSESYMKFCDGIFSGEMVDGTLDLGTVQYIEKTIGSLLSADYISYLNDPKKYDSLSQKYNGKKDKFVKIENTYRKKRSQVKINLLKILQKKYADLQSIDGLNQKDTIVLGEINKNTSTNQILRILDTIVKEEIAGKKKYIHDNYLYIIYFYAANDLLDKIPSVVYEAYAKFTINESTLDACLNVIKNETEKCKYNPYYDLDTTVFGGDYHDVAKNNISNKIDSIYKKYIDFGGKISVDILKEYNDKDKLDIITLYDLYETLKRQLNIFTNYKEYKFVK